jgi:hypothetical protein
VGRPTYLFVYDERAGGSVIEAFIGVDPEDGYTKYCHVVVIASRQGSRGPEWVVGDYPDGAGEQRQQTVTGKAAARSLVKRLAKEHAKKLGVPMWVDAKAGAR